jgi:hypothetical protein
MKYAKLVSEQLVFAQQVEIVNGNTVGNPTPKQLVSIGYKEYVTAYPPEPRKWYYPVLSHTETKKQILQKWDYIKEPAPPDYKSLKVSKIQERYDHNDEIALLKKGLKNPQDENYIAYCDYVLECKEWALSQINEYNNA